jgi:phi LC3 family holin
MIMINWIVRLKNKNFWIALIPAVIVLVQQVVKTFGIQINLGELGNNLLDIVNSVFIILAILGIVVDPTTDGIKDSVRALTYNKPKKDIEE